MAAFHASPFLEVDFEVLQWDTVEATVYFVVPSHFPGAGRYRVDSATLAPGRLTWRAHPKFAFGTTAFNASVALILDGQAAEVSPPMSRADPMNISVGIGKCRVRRLCPTAGI